MSLKPYTFHNAIRMLIESDILFGHEYYDSQLGSLRVVNCRSSEGLILDWNTYKSMYIVLHPKHFTFSAFDTKVHRWFPDIEISYDIERGEFSQLIFAYELHTLEYKNIKYLTKIRDIHYGISSNTK